MQFDYVVIGTGSAGGADLTRPPVDLAVTNAVIRAEPRGTAAMTTGIDSNKRRATGDNRKRTAT